MSVQEAARSLLWDRFLREARTRIRVADIVEGISVRETPYDTEDMLFEGDFRLKNGEVIRVTARYDPTHDYVSGASIRWI